MTDFNRDSGRERNARRSDSRVPPHNLNAEESLLGALLLSRDVVDQIGELGVMVDHFYKPSHQHIYAAIRGLMAMGQPVDAVTVADELRRNGLLDEIGGPQTLLELQNATPAISNASRYAKIVQDTAMLRKLIGVASEIAEIAFLEPDDVTKALDEAETKVFEIAEDRITDTTRSLSDLLPLAMDKLQETFERGDIITGTATGFHDLDEILSGLQPSTLNIIGARPAMGKTSLGLGIAAYVAQTSRRPVLIFSLEMGHTELTQRILSSEAEVDSQKLRTGRLVEADWTKIGKAINRLDVPLYLDDNPRVTVMEIRAKARRMKARQGGLALIVIDYLQLMSGGSSAENRQLEVSEISRGLKILARELEVPIIALSQLSRNLETRGDKRPMLSDLRESGCLTADTRLVRADTNAEVTLGSLVESGETGVKVWSLDERYRLVPGTVTAAFSSGVKPVFRLRFASGRTIDASANHPFLALGGWVRVEDLEVGEHLATGRRVPEVEGKATMADDELIVGIHGGRATKLAERTDRNRQLNSNPNVDIIPKEVWDHVRHKSLAEAGMTARELAAAIGMSYCGSALYKSGCSRARLARVATATNDPWLADLVNSDVMWDRLTQIEPLGEMEVFDATVEPHHNFLANGVVAHNSLEQDADVVMFLYRDEVYNKESTDKAMAEVIIAKHRSGPTGTVRLVFRGQFTKFGNAARGV
jgi:replicative DNA helicase